MRKSIYIPGFAHINPVPAACAKGGLVMTGGVSGNDPKTGQLPPTIDEQCRNVFGHFHAVMSEAGGAVGDIIKVTVWLADLEDRPVVNQHWLAMFPDPADRPARHVHRGELKGGVLVVCEITAVVEA